MSEITMETEIYAHLALPVSIRTTCWFSCMYSKSPYADTLCLLGIKLNKQTELFIIIIKRQDKKNMAGFLQKNQKKNIRNSLS